MNSSPDNFDSLEKLLHLKRHEQPPPRYFNEFSGRVIDRIARGDARLSWWERFGFDLRPALAAGAGMVACGLIVYGVATTDGDAGVVTSASMAAASPASVSSPALLVGTEQSIAANSTNPATYGTSIDQKIFRPRPMPVSFPGQ
jgi:hypothetical protein